MKPPDAFRVDTLPWKGGDGGLGRIGALFINLQLMLSSHLDSGRVHIIFSTCVRFTPSLLSIITAGRLSHGTRRYWDSAYLQITALYSSSARFFAEQVLNLYPRDHHGHVDTTVAMPAIY